jgi:hypothetical protein
MGAPSQSPHWWGSRPQARLSWSRCTAPATVVDPGQLKVHLGPRVGFGGLMTNNLRSDLVLRVL